MKTETMQKAIDGHYKTDMVVKLNSKVHEISHVQFCEEPYRLEIVLKDTTEFISPNLGTVNAKEVGVVNSSENIGAE